MIRNKTKTLIKGFALVVFMPLLRRAAARMTALCKAENRKRCR